MRALALLVLSSWACDRPDAATDASDAQTSQLRARAGETTVWIGDRLVRRGSELIASGRTSRNLTGGTIFVFDDVYGTFEQKSARRYDLRFSTTELTTLITGVQTFARFHFAPSSTRPDTLTGRVIASIRLGDFGGSGIYLEQPEVSGGSFRIRATSNRGLIAIEASAGGMPIDAALLSPTEAAIDLPIARAIDLVGTDDRIEVRARTATGPASKSARLDLMVSSFELTDGDPSVVWPSEAIVDDVALQAALSRADSRVASIGSDATALVGADRLEAFLDNVRRTIESQLEPYFDRRYPTAAERDQALDAEIELGIDAAYARPLDQVDALPPSGNDPERARNYAADALLLHLSAFDTSSSEWGRPLEELTRMFRDRHVAALRELREVGPIIAANAGSDVYSVDWLDALVEVEIDRATGEVVRLLLEID